MRLPEIAIKRPVFITMIGLALIVFGIVAFPRLALDLFPKIDFPVVNITTKLVGASPEIMEVDVTDTIEEAVNTINGVKSITSRSMEEYSIVTVEFYLERNLEQAAQDVRDKVAAVRNLLPEGHGTAGDREDQPRGPAHRLDRGLGRPDHQGPDALCR